MSPLSAPDYDDFVGAKGALQLRKVVVGKRDIAGSRL